jgi:predicted nucleic acid-binding protein
MGAVVLDSSVLIGLLNAEDAHHEAAARRLELSHANGEEFVLPASVLAEVMIGRIRSDRTSARAAMYDVVAAFGPVRPVDADIAFGAAELRARHRSLRLPDALVIATAVLEDAPMLTFDKRLASVDERVQVIEAD